MKYLIKFYHFSPEIYILSSLGYIFAYLFFNYNAKPFPPLMLAVDTGSLASKILYPVQLPHCDH